MQYITRYTITDNLDPEYSVLHENTVEGDWDDLTAIQSYVDSLRSAINNHATTSETAGEFNVVSSVSVHNGSIEVEAVKFRIRIRVGQWYMMYCLGRTNFAEFIAVQLTDA
jgi:hypothetical protein